MVTSKRDHTVSLFSRGTLSFQELPFHTNVGRTCKSTKFRSDGQESLPQFSDRVSAQMYCISTLSPYGYYKVYPASRCMAACTGKGLDSAYCNKDWTHIIRWQESRFSDPSTAHRTEHNTGPLIASPIRVLRYGYPAPTSIDQTFWQNFQSLIQMFGYTQHSRYQSLAVLALYIVRS